MFTKLAGNVIENLTADVYSVLEAHKELPMSQIYDLESIKTDKIGLNKLKSVLEKKIVEKKNKLEEVNMLI